MEIEPKVPNGMARVLVVVQDVRSRERDKSVSFGTRGPCELRIRTGCFKQSHGWMALGLSSYGARVRLMYVWGKGQGIAYLKLKLCWACLVERIRDLGHEI